MRLVGVLIDDQHGEKLERLAILKGSTTEAMAKVILEAVLDYGTVKGTRFADKPPISIFHIPETSILLTNLGGAQ